MYHRVCVERCVQQYNTDFVSFVDLAEFVERYETCLHIKSLTQILCGFDNKNNIDACNFSISEVVEDDHSYLVIMSI